MNNPQIIILGIAGVIAVLIIVVGIFMTRSEENLVEERLGRFNDSDAQSFLSLDEDEEFEEGGGGKVQH